MSSIIFLLVAMDRFELKIRVKYRDEEICKRKFGAWEEILKALNGRSHLGKMAFLFLFCSLVSWSE